MSVYGHTTSGPVSTWEPLIDHLRLTALGDSRSVEGARTLAGRFGAAEWGELAGWWHDLGKYSAAFQRYLRDSTGVDRDNAHIEHASRTRVDHSTFGAQHAHPRGAAGQLLAACIAGHHAGLPDSQELRERLAKDIPDATPPSDLLDRPLPAFPPLVFEGGNREGAFQFAFFTRMVFSALVDADFLATESFMDPDRATQRNDRARPTLDSLAEALAGRLADMQSTAPPTRVNRIRAELRRVCTEKVGLEPGFFTLTVPTGGGKTLTSLEFALRHATRHALERVIFAVPFTSIIEQTADVYRDALAPHDAAVLEHHSNFEARAEDRWSRLASENWDAPVVVTTNVQLYESLFACKPSRCRKLNRVAKSVIVLDEVQSIPVNLLAPTLAALAELVRNYGCSIVLCSATQPAVGRRDGFDIGLPIGPDRELADIPDLFPTLRRTRVEPARTLSDAALASELALHHQALAIVRTRRDARAAFDALGTRGGNFFLSTDLCAAHRSEVIATIKQRLKNDQPCRVVSTSLIEAGVDLDFPVVYRAFAGLDAIAQAAGRCNREGRLDEGRVIVFHPESPVPKTMPYLEHAIAAAGRAIEHHDDPLGPEAIEAYFNEYYWTRSVEWDKLSVLPCFDRGPTGLKLDFREAAARYRVIDNAQTPIVVPWGEGERLIEEVFDLREPTGVELRRRCQRFSVGVYEYEFAALVESGAVIEANPEFAGGVFVLIDDRGYSAVTGLLQHHGCTAPTSLVV